MPHSIDLLITTDCAVITCEGPVPRIGAALGQPARIDGPAGVAIDKGKVVAVGKLADLDVAPRERIDVGDRLITPGLVDAHTHPIFAKDRADEFILRAKGADYEAIAQAGGGILNSTRVLRDTSEADLLARTADVFDRFLAHGTTTIEAKSGYGLSVEDEAKSLRVVKRLSGMAFQAMSPARQPGGPPEGSSSSDRPPRSADGGHGLEGHATNRHPLEAVPTFLGAHEVPADYRAHADGRDAGRAAYVQHVIDVMIPAIAAEGLAEYCDVFCERGVFTAEESERILRAGLEHGMKPRIHTDEFEAIGGTAVAARVGARSADHLHATTDEGVADLKRGNVAAVLLPGTSFFLNIKHDAPARKFIDAGLAVVIATDYNPGSSHILSLPFCFTLAALKYGMTPEECLVAATVNAAHSLDRGHRLGQLAKGYDADLVVWNARDVTTLAYAVADNRVHQVYKTGKRVVG